MQDIIERVARAISRRFIQANKDAGHPTNLTWKDYRADAIAAIEAMREPPFYVLAAGAEAKDMRPSDVKSVFQAMIDAALNGSRPDAG